MNYRVELDLRVVFELEESYQWYEDRSQGLGVRFMTLVNKRVNEIATAPESYRKTKGNYREALVDVFPYVIIMKF